MQTGNRWSGRSNPRDLTLTRQQKLLADKAKKDAAADIDVDAVIRNTRKRAFDEGFQVGHDVGWTTALDGVRTMYKADGIGAIKELMDELEAPDGTEAG
jgi:hypothetical protein